MNARTPLTIGIDARPATEISAGRGRVVRELLRCLAANPRNEHRYILYARQQWSEISAGDSDSATAHLSWRILPGRNPFWHRQVARAADRECDVFLSANSYLTSWFTHIPSATVVYDMVTFDRAMQPNRQSMIIERATLGRAVRRSEALIAISQATADALAAHFPRAATRTKVALLGRSPALDSQIKPDEQEQMPAPGYVLSVGTLEPRKNLPRLVAAYSKLDLELQRAHPLVVVGSLGWQMGETLQALQALGPNCTRLGYVSDALLAELYRQCAVFCYPSLGEGFGLPVLEAMAVGAAVLTSNTTSLPEVGGDAVAYADPYDVEQIAAQLRTLLRSPELRAELGAAAQERSKLFSWERFTDTVLDTLEEAASGNSPAAHSHRP